MFKSPISLPRLATRWLLTALPLVFSLRDARADTLFQDDFDAGNSAANWTTALSGSDGFVDFAFDYGRALGIPAAPRSASGTTVGARFLVNQSQGVFQGISASPTGKSFGGDFTMRFDAWLNFVGPLEGTGSGSTQMASFGWGSDGVSVQTAGSNRSILFAASSDGGTALDYRVYKNNAVADPSAAANPGVYSAGNSLAALNHTNPFYARFGNQTAPAAQIALFPGQSGHSPRGTFGMTWHDVVIRKTGSHVVWTVDGLEIASAEIADANLSGSNIFLGMFDINNASSTDPNDFLNAAIYDNLRVESAPPRPLPNISLGDVALEEGQSGTKNAVFTLTLSEFSAQTVSVSYTTANGAAQADEDYTPQSGTLQFAPGSTSQTVSIHLRGDSRFEADETFFLDLSGVEGANIEKSRGVGTILNDDADQKTPGMRITAPRHRSFITSLPRISGVAVTDSSAIARVDLFFKRQSDGKFWNGRVWEGSTPVALATTLEARAWSNASELPVAGTSNPSKKLEDGSYLLTATAFDQTGAQKSASSLFTVDRSNPAIRITTPLNESAIRALPTISGTATDSAGGSGIARVEVFLRRFADRKHWNGRVWEGDTPVALPGGWNGGKWGVTAAQLPSLGAADLRSRLTQGAYLITAVARDKSGNRKSATSLFTVDRVAPAVLIVTPAHRSTVTALNGVSGTATDPGGSGVARLDVFLRRNADGKFWNGRVWSRATPVALFAGLNEGKWGITSAGLPSPTASDIQSRLTAGAYTLFANATDRAGNRHSASSNFRVTLPNSTHGNASAPIL